VTPSIENPTIKEIADFLSESKTRLELPTECFIIMLIYLEKVLESSNLALSNENWRPVIYTSLLIASKVWEDVSSGNGDFATAYPDYSLSSINRMEHLLIALMNWKLFISPN